MVADNRIVDDEDVDEDNVLQGVFRSMGETTGVLVVPDLDLDKVEGVDYEVVQAGEYDEGELVKVYFKLDAETVGFRYYRIPEQYRSFVWDEMKNFSVVPPEALERE